jgi:hypothetical protein
MKESEFISKAKELKINPRWYSLNGKIDDDCFVVREKNGVFEVFYYERYEEVDLKPFKSKELAISYLYDLFIQEISLGTKFL